MNRSLHVSLALVLVLAPSLVGAATWYLSPTGSNSNACTTGARCATVAGVMAKATFGPGDTIVMGDGTYTSGFPNITCTSNPSKFNGTAGARITLTAEHERRAFLKGDGSAYPILLYQCAYWTIHGLRAEGGDFESSPLDNGYTVSISGSNNIIFRRNLVRFNNRYKNGAVVSLYGTTNSLIEENEVYSYHRNGMGGGDANTYRRNYINSRNYADISGGYVSHSKTLGDSGYIFYPSSNNLVENNISEGNERGYDLEATDPVLNNRFYGNISLQDTYGALVTARGSGTDMPHDNLFVNFLAVNYRSVGLFARSAEGTQCQNCSFLGGTSGNNGISVDSPSSYPGDGTYSFFATNILAVNHSESGIQIASTINQWSIDEVNSFAGNPNFNPSSSSRYQHQQAVDPQLGACKVFIPEGSPMKRAGTDGQDIGANILYRYQDGVLTTQPLWDQNSGKFPCGAAVIGVNDIPGDSCFDVHQRLSINTGGCPFPPGYGPHEDPPTPIGNVATYTFDENVGVVAGDTSGYTHTLTLSSPGWAAPIIGVSSLATNGSRYASVPLAAGISPPTTVGLVAWWNGTTPHGCDLVSLGNSAVLRITSTGLVEGFFYNGTNWPGPTSSPINMFDGQSHMAWMTKSPTEVRVGVDTALLGSTPVTGTIAYTLGNQLTIGTHGNGSQDFTCPSGRIDMVRLFDTELTPTAILNLYNEQVPTAGLSVTHIGWFAADAPEGTVVGTRDTNLNQLITAPVGVRWSIHKADTGAITEYFRPFCRVFSTSGALMLDWTEITNSFGLTGIRFYADSVVTTGTPTSVYLPLDGFISAPGVYLDNPVDLTSPYNAAQRLTLSQAGHVEMEMKIEFGSPRVAGERIECRPQRENGAPFTIYMGSLP